MRSFSVTVENLEFINVPINIIMEGFETDRMDIYNKLYSFKGINKYIVIYSIDPGYVLPVWFIFVKSYSLINRIIKQHTCQLRNLPRCKKFQNCCTIIKMVKRFLPLIYAICGFIHTVYHENYKLDFVSNINYLWAYNDKSSKKYQFDREIVK